MQRAFVIALAILLSSCAWQRKDYLTTNYQLDAEMSALVGATMITIESGKKDGYGAKVERFTQELLYGGMAGSVVKIAYREFGNSYARPAFSQEVQYDLSASKTVTFRDITLEIVEASNDRIRYRVLEGPTSDVALSVGADESLPIVNEASDPSSPYAYGGTIGVSLQGMEVLTIVKDLPAYQAGIREHDRILQVESVKTTAEAHRTLDMILEHRAPDVVVTIARQGKISTFSIHRVPK